MYVQNSFRSTKCQNTIKLIIYLIPIINAVKLRRTSLGPLRSKVPTNTKNNAAVMFQE